MSLPKSSSTGVGEALGPGSRRTSSSGSAEPGTAHHEVKSPVRDCTSVPRCGRETAQQDDGEGRTTRAREAVFLPSAPVLVPCDPGQDYLFWAPSIDQGWGTHSPFILKPSFSS